MSNVHLHTPKVHRNWSRLGVQHSDIGSMPLCTLLEQAGEASFTEAEVRAIKASQPHWHVQPYRPSTHSVPGTLRACANRILLTGIIEVHIEAGGSRRLICASYNGDVAYFGQWKAEH